jgi:hypothetical protein
LTERLVCPECKQEFTDPRHYGRHRRFTHGVPGKKNFRKDGTLRVGATVPPGTTLNGTAPPPRSSRHAFTCDKCGEKYKDARALGSHRRIAHGIPGKSAKYNTPEALAERDARRLAKQNGTALAVTTPAAVTTNGNGHTTGRAPIQRSPGGFPLQFIGHIVGYLEARCHQEAYEHNLPAKTFTRDVAEYFLAKTQLQGGG